MTKSKLIQKLTLSCAVAVLAFAATSFDAPMAAAAVNEKSTKSFEKAKSYVEKGDINAAVIELKNAIRTDGNNVDARYQLAMIYLAQGNPQGAEKELRSAMSRGYDEAEIIPTLANVMIMQGKNRELIEEFGDKTLEGSAQAILAVRRGQAHLVLQHSDKVRAELEMAKNANADLAEIYVIESWLLQSEGDMEGAEASVDIALEKSDKSAEALWQKAEIRRLRGDNTAAVDFATRSLEVNPYRRQSLITRGLAYAAGNNVDDTLADAETLIERNAKDPLGAFLKGWALAQKGETDGALAAMAEGIGVESYLPALYLSSALHLRAGQLEQARSKIDRFLDKAPESYRGKLTAAAISYQSGDFDEAVSALEPLYAGNAEDSKVVTMLAYAYEQSGEREKAAALFDEASALTPDNEDLTFRSAQAKIGSGDVEAGVEDLAGLVDSATGGPRAATLLFLTHLRAKDTEKAKEALAQLETMGGKTAETANFHASLALSDGDIEPAMVHLKEAIALNPDFKASRLNLARVLRVQKDAAGSKDQYSEILKRTPGYLPAIKGLIELAADANDADEVRRLYVMGAEKNPTSEQAHQDLVNYYIATRNERKAMSAARTFMGAMPESPAAYDALARSQILSDDLSSAVVSYQQLTNLVPDNPNAHFRLASVLIRQESFTDAMYALDRVLTLDPEFKGARTSRIGLEKQVHGNDRGRALARSLYRNSDGDPVKQIGLGKALVDLDAEKKASLSSKMPLRKPVRYEK